MRDHSKPPPPPPRGRPVMIKLLMSAYGPMFLKSDMLTHDIHLQSS